MKSRILLMVTSVAFLAALAHGQETKKAPDKVGQEDPVHEELRALKRELVDALNKSDIDAILTKLDKDVVVTWMNGEVSRGPAQVKEYLERMTRGEKAIVKSYKTDPQVDELTHLYNGETGIAFGSSKDTFVLNDGREFTITPRWSATLVKKDGKWLIASFHGSANAFDNPILRIAVKQTATWTGGIAAVIALLLVGVTAWYCKRPASPSPTP